VTGEGCVTDLGSGEQLCGGDAKRFCTDLAEQRRAERRVERHDFSEQRRLAAQNARDLERSADIQAQLGNDREAALTRRSASDTRRDAARPFRPRPADPADLESARVCREAVER